MFLPLLSDDGAIDQPAVAAEGLSERDPPVAGDREAPCSLAVGLRRNRRRRAGASTALIVTTSFMSNNLAPSFSEVAR